MMRFRCPHCQQILEVEGPADTLLCPSCEMWCRIPPASAIAAAASQRSSPPPWLRWEAEGKGGDFEIRREPSRPGMEPTFAPPQPPLDVPPVIAPPATVLPSQETVAEPPLVESPATLPAESEEVLDVEFEVVKKGGQRRRKRGRGRRLLRSLSRGFDYWVGPTLILLVIFGPAGLFLSILMFWLHPMAGVGTLMMVGGGLWLMLLAAEDGFLQALLVLLVPFYVLYYVFANYERALIPFIIQCIGGVILMVSLLMSSMHAVEKQLSVRAVQGTLTHTAA